MFTHHVLAANSTLVEFASLNLDEHPTVGQPFERDPLLYKETQWRVIKVFEDSEREIVEGLIHLVGHEATRNLFNAKLMPPDPGTGPLDIPAFLSVR